MTILVYLVGISVTVSWSVWAYQVAPAPHKTMALFWPVAVLTGFIVLSFRSILDLPLVVLFALILGITRGIYRPVIKFKPESGPKILFATSLGVSALLVVLGFALRSNPYVLIMMGRIQGLALSPESMFVWATEGTLASRVNQLFLALVSYVPVAVFRMAVARVQRVQLQREIDMLKVELQEIREKVYSDPLDDSRL